MGISVSSNTFTMFYFVVFTTAVIYLYFMKNHFNTYSVTKALRQERERNALEDKYYGAHEKRDQLVHHLAWAESRGEPEDQLNKIFNNLKEADKEIDILELSIKKMYSAHGVRAESPKLESGHVKSK